MDHNNVIIYEHNFKGYHHELKCNFYKRQQIKKKLI